MAEDQQGNSAPFSTEPSEIESGLMWSKGWSHNPAFAGLFEPSPQMGIDGEIREVRITKSRKDGSYAVQVGFIPKDRA